MSEPIPARNFGGDHEYDGSSQNARLVTVCGQIADLLAGRYPNYNKPLDLSEVEGLAWMRGTTVRLERGLPEINDLMHVYPFRVCVRGKGDGFGTVGQMFQVGLDGENRPNAAASFVGFSRSESLGQADSSESGSLGAPEHPELQSSELIVSNRGLLVRRLPLLLPDDLFAMEQIIAQYAQQ